MRSLLDTGRIGVLGHRGARAHAQENTVTAFRLAAEQGADGVELDARRTKDGRLVVHHDPAVDGTVLVDLDLSDVRRRWPWMPTLAEALDSCAGQLVNVEIKNDPAEPDHDPDDRVAAATAELIAERGLWEETIVSSFNPATTARLRSLDGRLRTGQLLPPPVDPRSAVAAVAAAGHQAIHPWVGRMEGAAAREAVESAHSVGLWVLVWTVNEAARVRSLAAAGVDAVIVDDPRAALAALDGG